MLSKLESQIKLLINGDENRKKEFLRISKESGDEKYIAVANYRVELIKRRNLEQELPFNKLKKDFKELNLEELRLDFEILDLTYIKIKEINYILKIMNKNKWTIKDLYETFSKGSIYTIKGLVCCKNSNI